MILITGASGHIGRRTAEILAQSGQALRLMTRDPARAPQLPGSTVVAGDYADSASLDAALAGVATAFIISGEAQEGKRARLHMNAIDAAVRAGVGHVVYLSFQGAAPTSRFPMARDHALTEAHLAASGLTFTALRDSMYTDGLAEMFNAEGIARGPAGAGAAAWVAREDVAQVAAAVLRQPAAATGIFDVTGPEAVSFADAARRLSRMAGRELRYIDETRAAGFGWRKALGVEDWEVDTWLGSYEAIAAGELADVSDTVLRLTGRAPLSIEAYLEQQPALRAHLRGAA